MAQNKLARALGNWKNTVSDWAKPGLKKFENAAIYGQNSINLFDSAANAMAPFIQEKTARLKEENDVMLRNIAQLEATEFKNYLRDNKYAPDPDKGEEENEKKYIDKLHGYIKERRESYKDKDLSPYMIRQLDNMKSQYETAAQDVAMGLHDEWRFEQYGVDYSKNKTKIYNDQTLDAANKYDAVMNLFLEYDNKVKLSPAAKLTEQSEIINDIFTKELNVKITDINGNIKTVEQVKNEIDENIKNFREYIEKGSTEKKIPAMILDETINDREGRTNTAKYAAEKAIHDQRFKNINAKDHEYRNAAAEAMKNPTTEAINHAELLRTNGLKEKNAALYGSQKSEYSPDDMPAIHMMFPGYKELTGSHGGSGGGSINAFNILRNRTQKLVDRVFNGTLQDTSGNIMSLQDFKNNWLTSLLGTMTAEEKAQFGKDENEIRWKIESEYYTQCLYSLNDYVNRYFDDRHGHIYDLRNMADLIDPKEKMSNSQIAVLENFMQDVLYSVKHNTFTEEHFKDIFTKAKSLILSDKIPSFKEPVWTNDSEMLKAWHAIDEAKEGIYTDIHGKIKYLSPEIKNQITKYSAATQKRLEEIFGGGLVHNFRKEEGQEYDITGLGEYRLMDGLAWSGISVRLQPEEYEEILTGDIVKNIPVMGQITNTFKRERLVAQYKIGNGDWVNFEPEKEKTLDDIYQEAIKTKRTPEYIESFVLPSMKERNVVPGIINKETWYDMGGKDQKDFLYDLLMNPRYPGNPSYTKSEWEQKYKTKEDQRQAVFNYLIGAD